MSDGPVPNIRRTEAVLREMARSEPNRLIDFVGCVSTPGLLARAAEALGLVADSSVARPVLLRLLKHEDAVVQEGAIYGLAGHMDDLVRAELSALATSDATSPIIRSIALEALNETDDDMPARVVLSPEGAAKVAELIANPPEAGEALKDLLAKNQPPKRSRSGSFEEPRGMTRVSSSSNGAAAKAVHDLLARGIDPENELVILCDDVTIARVQQRRRQWLDRLTIPRNHRTDH